MLAGNTAVLVYVDLSRISTTLQDDVEVKLLPGDELRLRHKSAGARGAWEGIGYVVGGRSVTEEVCLEMAKSVRS